MKIKTLHVSEYKNLKDIRLFFNCEMITLLVGQNGLGKSNLIEILTIIFRNIILADSKKEFDDASQKYPFDYILIYEYRGKELLINYYNKRLTVVQGKNNYSLEEFIDNKEEFLPDNIIGYYSGENKRVLEIVTEVFDKQKKKIRYYHSSESDILSTEKNIFFAENHHSQILLLTLALYSNKRELQTKINTLFSTYLNIESVDSFDITFNNPPSEYYKRVGKGSENFLENYNNDVNFPFWNLKGNIDKLIGMLFNEHIDKFIVYDNEEKKEDSRRFVSQLLEFSNTSIVGLRNSLYEIFPTPKDFFEALKTAYILEVLSKITISVKLSDGKIISFEQLSEGQQQIITILGLIIIYGEDESLFLLDEPDTHINPNWQRNYVSQINDLMSDSIKNHFLISTHSPLLIQSYTQYVDLFLFRNSEDNNVIVDTQNHTIRNWRIDQVLMSEYFNLLSTRPQNIDQFMKTRIEIIQSGILTPGNRERLKSLENELGFLPTGETILEIENMALINHTANLIRRDEIHR